MRRVNRTRRGRTALAVAVVCVLGTPALALGAFPDPNGPPALGAGPERGPSAGIESVRLFPPNDPNFDRCESEDGTCSNVFGEQYERFGFAPTATQSTAFYKPPFDAHVLALQAQNLAAGRNPIGQVPGVAADRAWKYTTGDPTVRVAILDTGIRWNNGGLRKKIALNAGELPTPQLASGINCPADDCDLNGAFDVDDYALDPRVDNADGHAEAYGILDASDLLAAFDGDGDGDNNGYVDDIAGWDFFDDDNDPYDASSYSSASNHGTGRAAEAAEQGNENAGGIGVCPRCRIVPMRVWDTFVADTNNFAQAAAYAGDNGIDVVEGAVGALFNSRFAREAFRDAYKKGTFFAIVSSDLNTANHNVPTLYDEAMQVQGTVADQHGLGTDEVNCLPGQIGGACAPFPPQLISFLNSSGVPTNAPVLTWFRNSGTTQYGGHAHVVFPGPTGSQATGQAAGAAGLLKSYGNRKGAQLKPNEIKQLMTLTSQDVVPQNTSGTGVPDPSQVGWDQHFGYGLPDLGKAMQFIEDGKIPPQALITSPDWFAPLNVSRQASVEISGRVSARNAGGYNYQLQWAPGIEPTEADFVNVGAPVGKTAPYTGTLGTIDLNAVRAALDARPNGGSTADPTAPSKGPGDRDPNEPAFTVRVVVTDGVGGVEAGHRGEDRKMLFAYRDTSLAPGWSKALGAGGEASPRLFDLDGDNKLDVIQADSGGRLQVFGANGAPLPSFNNGQPVFTQDYPNVHPAAPVYDTVEAPREVLRTPAIGDIDGDMEPEIVDSGGEHVYAWNADGSVVPGFPVRIDPNLSLVPLRTRENHIKRGISASPTLVDLNDDKRLDIVVPSLDQHVYAWTGTGATVPGFPSKLRKAGENLDGAEIINTAAVGNITGDAKPEIVSPTNEVDDSAATPGSPTGPFDALGAFRGLVINILSNAIGGSGRVYALNSAGTILPGFPTKPNGALPDALPFVGPGADQVLGNVDADPELEIIGNVATGDVTATNGNGSSAQGYESTPGGGEHVDKSKILNLFENPIVANLDDTLPGLEVIKGGVTLNQLVNLGVTVGQNLPYNHVIQAWNGQSGFSLPAFPQAVEDYQLLSSPAVADVSDAPGKEILVGTGLYHLRNINAQGIEGAGWPKFTGGWIFAVPAIGDADGDGKLDVTTLTREGFSFLWKTDRPVCGGNSEWWTSRHDEWSTGAYGTDARPPGSPRTLSAGRDGANVKVVWNAPGDDWLCERATKFRVLASPTPILHPTGPGIAPVGPDRPVTHDPGAAVSITEALPAGTQHVAVLYQDDNGNWGHLTAAAIGATPPPEPPPIDPAGNPTGAAAGNPPPAGGTPQATDSIAPAVRLSAPSVVTDQSASPYFNVTWSGRDAGGIRGYDLDVYEVSRYFNQRRGQAQRPRLRSLLRGTTRTRFRFLGQAGATYEFRLRATDRAGNRSGQARRRSVMPLDDRNARIAYSRGWSRVRSVGAYQRAVVRSSRPGATASVRVTGTRILVVGERSIRGGRLAVVIDGRRRGTISLRGRRRPRATLFRSAGLRRGRHTVRLTALGGGPAGYDAIAVVP